MTLAKFCVRLLSTFVPDGVTLQWGATSLAIEAKHVSEDVRDTLTIGGSVLTLPVLRMHWLKVTSPTVPPAV